MIPTGADLLRRIMDSRLLDVHVALPGQVQSFDPVTQTAYVQPMVKHVIEADDGSSDNEESYPVLKGIPVAFQRFGGYVVAGPLVPGDYVTVLFNEWSIDRFLFQGLESHPVDTTRHGWAGAVALPCGPFPQTQPITEVLDGLVIGKDGGTVLKIGTDGIVKMGATADEATLDFVALATKVATALTALKTAINNAACTPNDGGLAFKTAILASLSAWPGGVAATKVQGV